MYTLWFRIFNAFVRSQLTVHGMEHVPKQGPFIVAANHVGFLDAPILSLCIWKHTGQQAVFPTTPWVWRLFERFVGERGVTALGMLRIENAAPGAVVDAATLHLQHAGIVGIFPEGKRNGAHALSTGKTGTVRMAMQALVPVIPAGLQASNGGLGAAIWHMLSRKPLTIHFGAPLHFKEAVTQTTKDELYAMTDECMREIGRLCGKKYQRT